MTKRELRRLQRKITRHKDIYEALLREVCEKRGASDDTIKAIARVHTNSYLDIYSWKRSVKNNLMFASPDDTPHEHGEITKLRYGQLPLIPLALGLLLVWFLWPPVNPIPWACVTAGAIILVQFLLRDKPLRILMIAYGIVMVIIIFHPPHML